MDEVALLTTGAVAARLGVQRWKLAYYIERGDVPGPSMVLPGRRLFTEEDVAKIKAALDARPPGRKKREKK